MKHIANVIKDPILMAYRAKQIFLIVEDVCLISELQLRASITNCRSM